jgi:transposase
VRTIGKNLQGIVAHGEAELSTALMEGLNAVFSAVKRKARGYQSPGYMVAMFYFVAGKLQLGSYPSYGK